jgi:chromatin remodeling complex protein RSC6
MSQCLRGFHSAETNAQKSSAFMKALKPSPELAAIIGAESLPRTEATKRIWDYIKQRNLQNPANKRNILCDSALKAVMGKDEVTMFEMTGLVSKHMA